MQTRQVEVAVIGAGTAGMGAFRAALAHTQNAVLIEGGAYGTTCARVGCMPSKLLIAAAETAHTAAHAAPFGIRVPTVEIDGAAVMKRVRDERDRFVGFVTETIDQWPPEKHVHGWAHFIDAQTLQVDGPDGPLRIRAERIVIATGSHPQVLPAWREGAGDRLIINDDVFSWTTLPASVAVLGAGVIALELAQALHRLGVRVHVYARGSRVGPLTDPALQALAQQIFSNDLPLTLNASDLTLQREGDAVIVRAAGQEQRFGWVLAAAGRRPNLAGLQLENSGLPCDSEGVPVYDRRTCQVGDIPVFIAGDADDDMPLLHEAADEGRIAGDNAGRYPDIRVRPRRATLAVVFTDPQIMMAGQSHAQLKAAGVDFESGSVSFDDQGRSRVMLKNRGALQLYAERASGRLLGAEMIGPAAEHIGHLLAWSIQRGDTVQQMLDSPFYHPVVEEGLRSALRYLQRALKMGPVPVEHCIDCGPGA